MAALSDPQGKGRACHATIIRISNRTNGEHIPMPLTLSASPQLVEGARSYAERSGMTLEALVLAYLESVAGSGSGASARTAAVAPPDGMKTPNEQLLDLAGTWVADPEAEKAFEEMRAIDGDMWR